MYTIASIKQTCGGCPSQWTGETTNGEDIYIRYRWGCGRLDIDGETVATWGNEDGDNLDGICSLEDALGHLNGVLELPNEVRKAYYDY